MKQKLLGCCIGRNMVPQILAAFLILSLFLGFNTQAQIINPATVVIKPACHLSGTLETRLRSSSPEVTVKAIISRADASSRLNYVLSNNSSGASVKTYGPVIYDAVKKQITQDLTITPGTVGGFDIGLSVINADGAACGCSKSVSVLLY